jgi:hypothetical protein
METKKIKQSKTIKTKIQNLKIKDELKNLKASEVMAESEIVPVKSLFDFDKKNLRHYINVYKYQYNRNYNIIINMELINGEYQTFFVKADYKGFKFRGKRYIIDTTFKYYSQTFKNYMIDFHEEFCLPIKREIYINDLRGQLIEQDVEVANMLNPHILEQFTKSSLAEGILRGNSLNEMLQKAIMWIMISAISSIAMILLYMYKSGMFKSVGL